MSFTCLFKRYLVQDPCLIGHLILSQACTDPKMINKGSAGQSGKQQQREMSEAGWGAPSGTQQWVKDFCVPRSRTVLPATTVLKCTNKTTGCQHGQF
jgi:hypothetical protein